MFADFAPSFPPASLSLSLLASPPASRWPTFTDDEEKVGVGGGEEEGVGVERFSLSRFFHQFG